MDEINGKKPTIEIVPGTLRDIGYIAANARQSDRVEIFAAQTMTSMDMVAAAIDRSCALKHVIKRKGAPIACIFGASRRWGLLEIGFFATSQWPRVALATTKHIKRRIIPMLIDQGFNRVTCETLASYHEAHRWLESLGAVRECELPDYGVSRETFVQYAWRRSDFENVCPELDPGLRGRIGPAGADAGATGAAH